MFGPAKSLNGRITVLTLLALLLLSACQVESAIVADAAPIQAVATKGPLSPVIVATVSSPLSRQTFILPSPAPTLTPTATETTLAATAEATATATATLAPTFTPPALPFTNEDDHYWFWRPVPEGSAVWTDKSYPYGSTRGGDLRSHHGVEFNVLYNTQVMAAAPGTVVFAGSDAEVVVGQSPNFYGNVVVIDHEAQFDGKEVYTLYGHLNTVTVSVGDKLQALQPIGLSGATGVADGPHLHFEVRVGENSYQTTRNPLLWIYPFEGRGTVAGRVMWADGLLARNVPITLNRIDAPTSQYYQTATYADDSVNPDEKLGENFVIDDVVAGYYEVVVGQGSQRVKKEIWVFEYQSSFDSFTLEPSLPTDSAAYPAPGD